MAKSTIRRKPTLKEKEIQQFVEGGAGVEKPVRKRKKRSKGKQAYTQRTHSAYLNAIQTLLELRSDTPDAVSRNEWINEAIVEKLQRDSATHELNLQDLLQ